METMVLEELAAGTRPPSMSCEREVETIGLSLESSNPFDFSYPPQHGDLVEVSLPQECHLRFQYIDLKMAEHDDTMLPLFRKVYGRLGPYNPSLDGGWHDDRFILPPGVSSSGGYRSVGHPAEFYQPIAMGFLDEQQD